MGDVKQCIIDATDKFTVAPLGGLAASSEGWKS